MSRRTVALILIAGGLLWQLTFALVPGENNALLAKLAFGGWVVAFVGAVIYALDFLRQRWRS
jgi:hypothetical protein